MWAHRGRFLNLWRWTYTRYSGVEDEGKKKKFLGAYISNFETYTRHFGVADEEEQKKVLGGRLPF